MISQSMSLAMATKINMKKSITLGTNANIQFIVKEGQKIIMSGFGAGVTLAATYLEV